MCKFSTVDSSFNFAARSKWNYPSKENELQAQNDIIAQLTREMRLSNNGHLSGGSDVESSGTSNVHICNLL